MARNPAGDRRSPLLARIEATPDRTALVSSETGRQWTYRELADDVSAVAASLREQVPDRERTDGRPHVGYVLDPSPGFVTTLYALWHLGWTAVGLHTDLAPDELATNVEIADLDAVVVDGEYAPHAESVECPTVAVESLGDANGSPSRPPEPAVWRRDETALVLFTSGTTGEPKGVGLTLGNLLANATASAFRLGVDPTDRWLCCLPVSHMGGLAPAVRTVHYGTTLVTQPTFDPAETARVIENERVTQLSLVPTQLKRLLDEGWTPPASLETVLLGGAPATDDLLDRAEAAGVPVYPTYGMTETASQIATARPGERRQYPGTVGQPLVSTDVTILDDGAPVEPGEEGEIVVDGPTVTPGYLDAEYTDDAFGEYGFHTGDIGYRDDGGRLWVVGRADDAILTGGELVSPDEVVEVLVSHGAVADAAVVGVPDEGWGERVVALVVPADGHAPDAGTLRAACRNRLAAYKVPKTLEFVEAVPRTTSGTVDREAVRERFDR